MAEKKPNPKPAASGADVPVGKIVGSKSEKPTAPRPKVAAVTVPQPVAVPGGEFDVELVAIPCPPPVAPRKPREERSLIDLDRRDFIMMGAGAGGSLAAVLFGLAVAKVLQRKPDDDAPQAP